MEHYQIRQYLIYSKVLEDKDPERILYLAVSRTIFSDLFSEPIGQMLRSKTDLRLMVFNPLRQEVFQWIP